MGEIGQQRMAEELEWFYQAPKLLDAYAKFGFQWQKPLGATAMRKDSGSKAVSSRLS
jgi:hypothetical protein